MSETLEKDFSFDPDAALDEGFEIKWEMCRTQDFLDKAADIEKKMIDLAYEIPVDVRSNKLIESCEESIRNIERSDFAEYGERIDRNIKLLDEESAQAVNKLKESLSSANDKLDEVISIAEELSDEISYEKYKGMLASSAKISVIKEVYSNQTTDVDTDRQKQEKLFEIDEINNYLNFLMAGRHESTSYFELREKYKKQLLYQLENEGEADFKLADGSEVSFYSTGTSFEDAVDKQYESYLAYAWPKPDTDEKKRKALEDLRDGMNPFIHLNGNDKYQFIDIRGSEHLTTDEIEKLVTNNDNGFTKYASAFKSASENYDISMAYLVSHSCLETKYGESNYAKGVSEDDNLNVKYYNFYGYAGFDDSPTDHMLSAAKANGWTSAEAAIVGGAEKIKDEYIDDYHRRTRYEIRYNPLSPGENQYATDQYWAITQVRESKIGEFYDALPSEQKHYFIPVYAE